ncbi:MAG: type I secretion protein TolC [Legionellales bacterium]|nr:type I secretion protein TolC [Legionellales bacterium]
MKIYNLIKNASLLASCLLLSINSFGADLSYVYKLSEKNDQKYLQELASHRIVLESRSQALSQLLPSINFSAKTTRNDQEISNSGAAVGSSGEVNFNSRGYRLSITQPLFRRDRFIALEQAGSEIKQSEAELIEAQGELIIRVAERYFNILAKVNSLEFAETEVKSLHRQLEQAKQRFEVGLSAVTDVHEAQAGYDLAVAQKIQAQNAIDDSREAMRELTGEYIIEFDQLGESMSLVSPEPKAIEAWTQLSLEQNLGIIASSHAVEIARKEVKRQSAGRLPTLDLVAAETYDSSGGRFGSTKQHGTSIGIELNIPIYSGGLVSSQIRKAHENYNTAMYSFESARRSAQRMTREAYLGVIYGISRVKALKQAVVSSEAALEATKVGFDVGTRTAVDLVVSQRTTSEARRNYSQSKYDYIIDTLSLKQAAGNLTPEDLELINDWLTK